MHKHIADQWADALESNEYPQGFWALNENGNYCAIGVLAHLAWKAGIVTREYYETPYRSGYKYDDLMFAASPAVMEWAGLQHGLDVQIPSLSSSVMRMNDTEHMSFNYIGSIIRECYEEM